MARRTLYLPVLIVADAFPDEFSAVLRLPMAWGKDAGMPRYRDEELN